MLFCKMAERYNTISDDIFACAEKLTEANLFDRTEPGIENSKRQKN